MQVTVSTHERQLARHGVQRPVLVSPKKKLGQVIQLDVGVCQNLLLAVSHWVQVTESVQDKQSVRH